MAQDHWKQYHNAASALPISTFPNLSLYERLIPPGKVMDLGMGVGLSSLYFARMGYLVEGYDLSEAGVQACSNRAKAENIILTVQQSDIREIHIKEEEYSLIILSNVLQFLNDEDINSIFERAKKGLKQGGLLYFSSFSIEEPMYKLAMERTKQISERTFFNSANNKYVHFFTRNELEEVFNGYQTLLLLEGIRLDIGHGEPHYHGSIEGIFKKL